MTDEVSTPEPIAEPTTEVADESIDGNAPDTEGNELQVGEDVSETDDPRAKIIEDLNQKFTIKLNGEEVEVDLGELKRGYQLRSASDKKMAQADQLKRQNEAFIKKLADDPVAVMKHLKIDVEELADQIVYEKILREQMDPRDLKLQEYEKQEKQRQLQMARAKHIKEQKELQAIQKQDTANVIQEIQESLKASKLPEKRSMVVRVVNEMRRAAQNGFPNIQAKDVISLVQQQYFREMRELTADMSPEMMMKALGDDIPAKIRNMDLEKVRGGSRATTEGVVVNSNGEKRTRKKKKIMSPEQLRAMIEGDDI